LFGELKKETSRTSNRRARKSRKRVDHQKEADLNPHQQLKAACSHASMCALATVST